MTAEDLMCRGKHANFFGLAAPMYDRFVLGEEQLLVPSLHFTLRTCLGKGPSGRLERILEWEQIRSLREPGNDISRPRDFVRFPGLEPYTSARYYDIRSPFEHVGERVECVEYDDFTKSAQDSSRKQFYLSYRGLENIFLAAEVYRGDIRPRNILRWGVMPNRSLGFSQLVKPKISPKE